MVKGVSDELRRVSSKQKEGRKKVAEGDIVIIYHEMRPRSQWRLGKVSKLLIGQDGYTRGVELEVASNSAVVCSGTICGDRYRRKEEVKNFCRKGQS